MLRTHCQTSGVSLQEQDPYNNVIRTAYEAMSAALGGTQSLHTNALDEAIALPTEFSARIARNTQIILQEETGVTKVVDPLAGSYYVESLTSELADKAWALMEEVEEMGGMTKAVESGMPKLRIEESAATRQAMIDRGEEVIVGVNKYRLEKEDEIDILDIDNKAVREAQIARLEKMRASRDEAACRAALDELTRRSKEGGNLLESAVEAARARASVGGNQHGNGKGIRPSPRRGKKHWPASMARRMRVTRRLPRSRNRLRSLPRRTAAARGFWWSRWARTGTTAAPRLSPPPLPISGSTSNVGPLFQTPEEAAQDAVDNDVHVVGISSQAAGHKTLAPQLIEALKDKDAEDIIVICGGVIPQQDYDFLKQAGVKAIFGPGTNIPAAAQDILGLIRAARN